MDKIHRHDLNFHFSHTLFFVMFFHALEPGLGGGTGGGWGKFEFNVNQNENENKNAMGEATYGGALRASLAGSPTCVFTFVFVLIYVKFELINDEF